jgi:N-methylhydantoinase A
LNEIYVELEREAIEHLAAEGARASDVSLRRTVDMRYAKQYHEVEVDVPAGGLTDEHLADLIRRFHEVHRRHYTFSVESEDVEFLTFRLRASTRSELRLEPTRKDADSPAKPTGSRNCIVAGARRIVPVFSGASIDPGHFVDGPALIEEPTTTVFVPPRYRCAMDAWRNYHIERKSEA